MAKNWEIVSADGTVFRVKLCAKGYTVRVGGDIYGPMPEAEYLDLIS